MAAILKCRQGGVLTRMLCTNDGLTGGKPAFSLRGFRSDKDFNRGRFRRIITLGSPHNGALLLHYLRDIQTSSGSVVLTTLLGLSALEPLIQPKFDPFGDQIHVINDGSHLFVDASAKFHLIRTNADGGIVATGGAAPLPRLCLPAYVILGLCGGSFSSPGDIPRENIVLPLGSDTIVDSQSATAGQMFDGGIAESFLTAPIQHANVPVVFGFLLNQSHTSYVPLASHVRDLLDGPVGAFGAFVLPQSVPLTLKAQIDQIIPVLVPGTDQIMATGGLKAESAPSAGFAAADSTETLFFQLVPSRTNGTPTDVQWFAEVFGPDGVTTNGVTVQVDSTDSTKVTVTVDSGVLGQVVLHGSYTAANGNIVVETPIVALARPPGTSLQSIELQPSDITVTAGVQRRVDIWGVYDTGEKAQLYVPDPSTVVFTSSDNSVATFDAAGNLIAVKPGTATITCTYQGLSTQATVTVTVTASLVALQANALQNISTRLSVETGDNVGIAGFIINGSAPKKVLIRAIGGSLPAVVPNRMQDPMISLHDSTTAEIDSNDDWQSHPNARQIPANLQPSDPRESAILTTLQPGAYTAIVSGKGGTTGVALAEVYDMDSATASELANISTRGLAQTGDFVMIGGFVAGGSGDTEVLIRAIGPSLHEAGLANTLADPTVRVFNANGMVIGLNDNWKDSQAAEIMATGKAPTNDLESAILLSLAHGSYTAIVSDKNGASGIAQVEVFKIH